MGHGMDVVKGLGLRGLRIQGVGCRIWGLGSKV